MTYGENGGQLRAELAKLLRQHRIQQRLGGPGIHTVPESTTLEQRELLGEQIQRYRHATLAWCLRAVAAASPRIDLYPTTARTRGPAEELRYRLARSLELSDAGLPPLNELTSPQAFQVVETWRQVAKAAVLGEHDFGAGVEYGQLSTQQCMAVLRDAAEITQALVVLDKRYEGIPGWVVLRGRGRLERAAEVGAVFAGYDEQDYTVDHRGWRPPPATIEGGPLPGIGGVLQAEHNMLVHLARFPNALNLRRVMHGQRILSHEAARRAPSVAPDLGEKWLEREQTYLRLMTETRNVGGLVGDGGLAAAEGANAVGRLRRLNPDELTSPEPLRDLDKLFARSDARIASIIEHGAAERHYFLRVKLPRIVDEADHLVNPVRERYVPISSPVQSDLLEVVRFHLRPTATAPSAPSGAADSRKEFEATFHHRPDRHHGPAR